MGSLFSKAQDRSNVTKDRQLVTANMSCWAHGLHCIRRQHTDEAKTGRHTGTTVNFVVLGVAGTGKSASGNTILGKKHFISRPSSKPVTTKCQNGQTKINDLHVRVIDTPDMFDDDIAPSVRGKHVKRCKQLCESGPCVYVLVMHVSRFTDGERDIMEKLEEDFGREVSGQTIILFTRGNDLQQAGIGLEDFLHSCQPDLKKMVEKCGNRCVLFENNKSGPAQVEKLMEKVNTILEDQKNL
ncbi:GTPase IMAP family member 8-like [Oreochromis niloticus]|uniref:GTPase IMAP family member 8-like n=1 Tax=Oreochromis niloticus TaxID=8128 RepID=I3KI22_ORENI|nr:GTPase IMAP family member 8-like [Oreochromis niloticus]